jgi:hypothetical protein
MGSRSSLGLRQVRRAFPRAIIDCETVPDPSIADPVPPNQVRHPAYEECDCRRKPDATNVAGIRAWNSLGRFVKRGEKGFLILAPMVGYRRSIQNEIATDIDADNIADERKPERQLVGFRAVYVFDRLFRDLRPSLCALDRSRLCHFRKSPR